MGTAIGDFLFPHLSDASFDPLRQWVSIYFPVFVSGIPVLLLSLGLLRVNYVARRGDRFYRIRQISLILTFLVGIFWLTVLTMRVILQDRFYKHETGPEDFVIFGFFTFLHYFLTCFLLPIYLYCTAPVNATIRQKRLRVLCGCTFLVLYGGVFLFKFIPVG